MYENMHGLTTADEREALRKQLEKDLAEFLKKGGKITQIPIGASAGQRSDYNNRNRKVKK